MKTLSGGFTASVVEFPASDATLLVGLGCACRRPLARPVLLGVDLVEAGVLFGEIDSGECGEWE